MLFSSCFQIGDATYCECQNELTPQNKEPQMTHTPAQNLAMLNDYRAAEGKAPFADWRNARHMPMLTAYREAAIARQDAEAAAKLAKDIAEQNAAPKSKQPAYKVLARQSEATSSVDNPVAFVHSFCDAHPEMSRKETVAALVAQGVNYSTARTQYQKWFAKKAK